MTQERRLFTTVVLVALTGALFNGCGGSDGAAPAPGAGGPPLMSNGAAAAAVSPLQTILAAAAQVSPAMIADHQGCGIAAAFDTRAPREALSGELENAIASAAAAGTLRSAELARKSLRRVLSTERALLALCVRANEGDARLAEQLLGSGAMLREALGLPAR
ncbi:MAG: hypothetical protein HY075_00340 [Deltaproteobacteria bacterium]|nr:hypothetical protein [Deltaproteobacteria bacterium]